MPRVTLRAQRTIFYTQHFIVDDLSPETIAQVVKDHEDEFIEAIEISLIPRR